MPSYRYHLPVKNRSPGQATTGTKWLNTAERQYDVLSAAIRSGDSSGVGGATSITPLSRDNLWISLLSLCMVGAAACSIDTTRGVQLCVGVESVGSGAVETSEKQLPEHTKRTSEITAAEVAGDSSHKCRVSNR